MRIAIEGCCHGDLDIIYELLLHIQEKDGIKVDLLICCGDFEAIRNQTDLDCMHVPDKFKHIGSFYQYYSGEKVAPIPTLFIHGNHEAINYCRELYYGGYVAPNIYYLGYSGVVQFGGYRIGGIGGIFNANHYDRDHYEAPPYHHPHHISAYHVRKYEVWKVKQIEQHVDIFLSHDWPRGIYHFGDKQSLIHTKPYFESEIHSNTLGSPVNEELLLTLKPDYWFSAHLHVKFAAVVDQGDGKQTKFLALDKCLPKRDFIQIIEVPDRESFDTTSFYYDEEWLNILRSCYPAWGHEKRTDVEPAPDPALFTTPISTLNPFVCEPELIFPQQGTARGLFENGQTKRFIDMYLSK